MLDLNPALSDSEAVIHSHASSHYPWTLLHPRGTLASGPPVPAAWLGKASQPSVDGRFQVTWKELLGSLLRSDVWLHPLIWKSVFPAPFLETMRTDCSNKTWKAAFSWLASSSPWRMSIQRICNPLTPKWEASYFFSRVFPTPGPTSQGMLLIWRYVKRSRALMLTVQSAVWQRHVRACWKCRIPGPAPALLNRDVYFSKIKIPIWFLCMLKLEKVLP